MWFSLESIFNDIKKTSFSIIQEEFYGRPLIIADRELVEQGTDVIFKDADKVDVALLVVGDPFGATTHTDLIIRAKELNIKCQVVHNASILNAAGCCGLQLYSFGETISIPYWDDSWKPDSFYDKIKVNVANNFHTLCLLGELVKCFNENIVKTNQIACGMEIHV